MTRQPNKDRTITPPKGRSTRSVIESEKKLEKSLANRIKELGGWAIKFLPFEVAGLPDRVCLMPGGVVFFVEVKTTGEKPSKIQTVVHNRLRRLGFKVYVMDSTKDLNQIIEKYESRI